MLFTKFLVRNFRERKNGRSHDGVVGAEDVGSSRFTHALASVATCALASVASTSNRPWKGFIALDERLELYSRTR